MALPRSHYVREGEVAVYHCTSRCVRRAFLYGYDSYSGRDYSHRKSWIRDRLKFLTSIFALELSSFSVMSNHYHVILRTRPDIVATWSDFEVASRWLTLCPIRYKSKKAKRLPIEEHVRLLANSPEKIAELRIRLSSLSWFMAKVNEFIARAANKEDQVKGRFWESRFKSQVLLDDSAIAACMVYVDLNPIRAGLATVPEESDFTSIQQRIRIWQKKQGLFEQISGDNPSSDRQWLCPISSDPDHESILPMSEAEYFNLVDRTGRLLRSDKRGWMDPNLDPILLRLRANPEAWGNTVSDFGKRFGLAAGILSNLRNFADRLGKQWFTGVSSARESFTSA